MGAERVGVRAFLVLRDLGWSEGVEAVPVGFACVEGFPGSVPPLANAHRPPPRLTTPDPKPLNPTRQPSSQAPHQNAGTSPQ